MVVLKTKAHVSYSQTTSPLLVTKGKRVTLVWQTPPSLSDKSVCHQQWDTSKLTRYNGKTQHPSLTGLQKHITGTQLEGSSKQNQIEGYSTK